MAAIVNFMESPLVTWIRTFSCGELIDYQDICDGVYLNDVLMQIDQRDQSDEEIHRLAKDTNARIQNWSTLMKNIKNYYQEMLQQMIVGHFPDIINIVKEPTKESSLRDMKHVLLLLLGCAVQGLQKENFVNIIKQLDIDTQEAIVEHIKQITDSTEMVVGLDIASDWELGSRDIFNLLRKITQERDQHSESIIQLTQERDYNICEIEGKHGPLTPPPSMEKYHMVREINKLRSKLHVTTVELEEKSKSLCDMKDDLATNKASLHKLQQENLNLSRDAKKARTYRDELDTLREKAMKAERLEKENRKYKEKMNELDFYKSRVEELREDNTLLTDAKSKMEEQMICTNKRMDNIMDELVTSQLQLEEANKDKEQVQVKMQDLVEENAALEFERSNMKEGLGGMRRILSFSSAEFLTSSNTQLSAHPISEELNETMASRVSRLECENDELQQDVEEYRQRLDDTQRELEKLKTQADRHYKHKVEELEKETKEIQKKKSIELSKEFQLKMADVQKKNEELKKKVIFDYQQRMNTVQKQNEDLKKQIHIMQDMWTKDKEQYAMLYKLNQDLLHEKEQFKHTISAIQESSQNRIDQLEREVDDLQKRTVDLKKNNDKIKNLCDNEINKDNAKYVVSRAIRETEFARKERNSNSTHVPPGELSGSHGQTHTGHTHTGGVIHRLSRPANPVRGVVAPQRRSVPDNQMYNSMSSSFVRGDHHRSSVTPMRRSSGTLPFSRDNRLRQSMPEKKMVFVAPERRSHVASSRSAKSRSSACSTPIRTSSPVSLCESDKLSQSFDYTKWREYSSDKDSGHATSPDSPTSEPISNGKVGTEGNHITNTSVITSDVIKTHIKLPKMSEKWKMFVDKIVELQDKNQQLILENSELRRTLNSMKFNSERLDRLEKKNVELEVDNKKLRKICESMQSSHNPHDSRQYLFYSNV